MSTTIKLLSMQSKLRLLVVTLSVILFSFVTTSGFGQATVSTDKDDYPPGATVIITGSGFQPGETVTLQVTHVGDGDNDVSGAHAPWDVVADANGNISSAWIVPVDEDELGATLKLTADGQSSGLHAETTFTDASSVTISSSPAGTGNPQTALAICSGTSVIFTATKSGGGCTPSFQWRKNGINIPGETSSTYTTSTLANGDIITVFQSVGSGGCTAALSTNSITVTITAPPVATFSYSGSPYCQNAINPLPTFSGGGTAGIFSATPAGLVFVSTSTGQINLSTSTPGTYTVKNTVTNVGCSPVEAVSSVTITAPPVAAFSYSGSPYCQNAINPLPTFSGGGTAGIFSATPAGLVFVSTSTGQINLSASTPGTYTVKNSFAAAGGCPLVEATSPVTITIPPSATINYDASPYCSNFGSVSVTRTGTVGGTYSSTPAGLSLNTSTGAVNTVTSTGGTYTVTYTIATAGGCPQFQTQASVTITTLPAATISYGGSPYCSDAGTVSVTRTGTAGGVYSATPAGLSINASTGAVNKGTSALGTYTVSYKFDAAGGCPEVTAITSITINAVPDIFDVSYTGSLCGTAFININSSESGVNYALQRNGSTVETKPGTGSGISFSGVTQSGTYTVVATNTTTTCSSTMNGSVGLGGGQPPTVYSVTGGGSYCTGGIGVAVNLSNSETGVTYQLYRDLVSVGSPVAGTNAAISFGNQTVAGNYTVIATKNAGGCMAAMTGSVSVTINTAPSISLQPTPQTATYGDASKTFSVTASGTPAPTYQWQVNTGSGFTNISGETSSSLTLNSPTVSMSGYLYHVVISNACSSVISNDVSFTITPLAVTVTADAKSKTYGDVDPALTFTSSPAVGTALANGQVIGFSGNLTRVAGETVVGSPYAIQQGSVANSNYNITYNGANLTITPLAVTVTADAKSKTYGDVDPALTFTSSPAVGTALANGQVIGFSGNLTRVAGETVVGSPYAIQQGSVANSNYNITYNGANLTINPRPISINVTSGQTKVFGTSDPTTFTYSVAGSGLASWDEFTGALSRTPGESVGNYPINQGTLSIRNSSTLVSAIGNYTVTFNPANFTISIASTNVTTVAITSSPVQYSDSVTFTATITSPTAQSQLNSSGGTVEFKLKSATNVVTSLGSSTYPAGWNATNGTATAKFKILQAPGTYSVIAVFTPNNTLNFNGSTNLNCGALVVTQENAVTDYTGDQIISTGSATTSTATIKLRTNIYDISATLTNGGDVSPGDIRNAKVKFIVTNGANVNVLTTMWLPVDSLVIAGDTRIGMIKYDLAVNIGSADADEFIVRILVGKNGSEYNGYYIAAEESSVVTVYKANGDFITGGGYIVTTKSAGTWKGDNNTKTHFGFNVKFNKKNTNLQGSLNFIFRRTENDNIQHIYQVKSNAMQSLGVNASNANRQIATFVSKGNITDITNPLTPLSLGGNKFMYINMIDNGEPGTKDSISFVLVDGSGDPTILSNIMYSSNWISPKTEMMNLKNGNLVVHSGFNLGTVASSANPRTIDKSNAINVQATVFEGKAYPNPTQSQFKVKLESSNTTDGISIVVYNVNGKIIETRQHLVAGQTIQIGALYRPGVYIIEMIQGKEHKQLKLVKIPD